MADTRAAYDVIHKALADGMPSGPGVTEPMRERFAVVAHIETRAVLTALTEAGYTLTPPVIYECSTCGESGFRDKWKHRCPTSGSADRPAT